MSARRPRVRRRVEAPAAQPFTPMRRAYAPIDALSAEEEDRVHALSLRILDEIGLKVLSPSVLRRLGDAGCRVDLAREMAWFPPELVARSVAQAPSRFVLAARDAAVDLDIGGEAIVYGSASSAPNVMDEARGRRPGTQADFRDLIRLSQMLGSVHFFAGHPVEPIDAPANTRHLSSVFDFCTLSDRVFRLYAIGETRARDGLAMIEIAHQIDRAELRRRPRTMTVLNVNSPLVLDAPLLEGAAHLAAEGQAIIVSPVAFSGAMSPISLSGSVIQGNAEALGAIATIQILAPGAPCFYGVLTTPVDMKSGAPAMGVPEAVTGALANGQMARRYGLPQRVMLGSTSNAPDAQAACESMFSLWAAQLCGAHLVYHAHGWMEGGLTASFEKVVLDAEMVRMMGALRGRVDFSDAEEAYAAIAEVGPGGHFLGTAHTLARYESAFHAPMLSDWRPYEFWSADGARDAAARAARLWPKLLEAYEEPPLPAPVRAELERYVARRAEEIGDAEI